MTRNQRIAEKAREIRSRLWSGARYYEVSVGGLKMTTRVAILDSQAIAEMERRIDAIIAEVCKP